MSEYDDIFLEIESLIAESEKIDDGGVEAGQDYPRNAQQKLTQIKKDGLHKKKSGKKSPSKNTAKDNLTGSKSKFKKEEEEEDKEKPDSSEELDKEFGEEESEDRDLLDLGKSSKYSKLIDMLNQFRSAKSFTGKESILISTLLPVRTKPISELLIFTFANKASYGTIFITGSLL